VSKQGGSKSPKLGGARSIISTLMTGKKRAAVSATNGSDAASLKSTTSEAAVVGDAHAQPVPQHSEPSHTVTLSARGPPPPLPSASSLPSSSSSSVHPQRESVGTNIYAEAELASSSIRHDADNSEGPSSDDAVAMALAMLPAPSHELLYAVAAECVASVDSPNSSRAAHESNTQSSTVDASADTRGDAWPAGHALYEYEDPCAVPTSSHDAAAPCHHSDDKASTRPTDSSTTPASAKRPPPPPLPTSVTSRPSANTRTSELFAHQSPRDLLSPDSSQGGEDDDYEIPERVVRAQRAAMVDGALRAVDTDTLPQPVEELLYTVPESASKQTRAEAASETPRTATAAVAELDNDDLYETPEVVVNTKTATNVRAAAVAARAGCLDDASTTTEL
jgi:hypothetical protein